MLLGYLADSHLRASTPSCRRDKDYYPNQLKKLREALAIMELHEAMPFHGGDLFHLSNSPLSLLHDVLPIFMQEGLSRFWVNPGNHDFAYGNVDTVRRSALGVLQQAEALSLMLPEFIWDKGDYRIILKTAPYMLSYPEDFYWVADKRPQDVVIVVAHDMLTTRPVPFPHKEIKDVRTNADLILCSHWHSQFIEKVGGTWFVNSGPLDIQSVDQRHIKPAVALVDILGPGNVKPRFEFLKTTGYEEVEATEEQERDLGLADDFIREVQSSSLADGADVEQAVIAVARESGHGDKVIQRVLGRLRLAQTCGKE